jgi:hypothetical protein
VRERLRFGYFFPFLEDAPADHVPEFDTDRFEYQFLDTYGSTALNSEAGVAEENSLHEIEVIRCWSRAVPPADSKRVHLVGHLAVDDDGSVNCQPSDVVFDQVSLKALLSDVQLGGKRSYGFGRAAVHEFTQGNHVFEAGFDASGILGLPGEARAAAHIDMERLQVIPRSGRQEPFVGREWREDKGFGAGQFISEPKFCWAPGTIFDRDMQFRIGDYGIWEPVP